MIIAEFKEARIFGIENWQIMEVICDVSGGYGNIIAERDEQWYAAIC